MVFSWLAPVVCKHSSNTKICGFVRLNQMWLVSIVFEIVCFCVTTIAVHLNAVAVCVCLCVDVPYFFLVISYFILLTPGYLVCLSPLDCYKSFLICYVWCTQFRVCVISLLCGWHLSVVHLLVFLCL